MDSKQVGKKIAEYRKLNGMTQKELAEKLNVIDKTVSRWECGYGLPDISMLVPMANIFGVSVEAILGEEYKAEEHLEVVATQSVEAVVPKWRLRPTLIVAMALSLGIVIALCILCANLAYAQTIPTLNDFSWNRALYSDADSVYVAAYGSEEVMSLELQEDGSFLCQITWQESSDGKVLDCIVWGTYTEEKGRIYFCANDVLDPDETSKLRTSKSLGLPYFEAFVEREGVGIERIAFKTTEAYNQTSAFGRWTKYQKYFSREKGEILFERVSGRQFTEEQLAKLPDIALADLDWVGLRVFLEKTVFFKGERFLTNFLVAKFGNVYDRKTVTAQCDINLRGKVLTGEETSIVVRYEYGEKAYIVEIPISVFTPSWLIAEESKADQVFYTVYSHASKVCFGSLELFEDGSFIYHETYGKNVLVSAAVLGGTFKRQGEDVSFHCTSFEANKVSTRFKTGTTYEAKCNIEGKLEEITFLTSSKNKNFFGVYADDSLGESLSDVTGHILFLPVVNGVLPEGVIEIMKNYKTQFNIDV